MAQTGDVASQNASSFCLNQLRELNYDRYLACLYLPEEIRGLAVALNAFDAEISKIAQAISEPMTGEIRIQWWRDTLSAGFSSTPTHNPLTDNLLTEMADHNLPLQTLDTFLQAKIFDLYNDPMPDLGTLEGYCGETASFIFQLLTMASKLEQNRAMADICGHAGMVSALTGILISLSNNNQHNRLYIPVELLRAKSIEPEDWFAGKNRSEHMSIVIQMLDLAESHLEKLNALLSKSKYEQSQLALILLPIAICRAYLRYIRRMDIQIFQKTPTISPIKKHWVLWRGARTSKF